MLTQARPLLLPLAVASQLIAAPAFAQNPSKNVTILRMVGPQLGVRLEEVDKDAVSRLKLKEERGALVTDVLENSAAEKAGIRKDDVIVRFQGESVLTAAQLARLVREVPVGRKVDLEVIRAGAPLTLSATIEKADAAWSPSIPDPAELADRIHEGLAPLRDPSLREKMRATPRAFSFRMAPDGEGLLRMGRPRLGISYEEIDGQLALYFKSPKDTAILIREVTRDSAAERGGLKAGDLLISLNSRGIADTEDLASAVRDLEDGKPAPVVVIRDGRRVELSVTVDSPQRAESRRSRRPVS